MKPNRQISRRPARNVLACALASCLLVCAPAVLAQSTSATLRGQVMADTAPASGATVTATNLATGLTRSVQSAANGAYSLAGLPPGSYRIDVNAGGKTSSRNVTLAVGQTATMDLGVGGAAVATTLGTVTVTGVFVPETKTSEIATYVSQKQIEALPQGSRNFLAFADTVPGMVFTTSSDDSTKLRGGGQNSNGINVFIDGVGQKNYVLKGGVTGQDTSPGNPFPQLGIAEYKVITSNYKAELDQVSSAAVVAVTKSGTNEFHGDVFYDFTNDSLRQPTEREERDDNKIPSKTKQYGASLGGPIIRDRAHFFVTVERKDIVNPREVSLGQNTPLSALPPDLQAVASETIGVPFKEDLYFAKLDWAVGDNHLFELTGKHRSENQLTNVGDSPKTASWGTDKKGDETRFDLRYLYSGERFLNDAHLTYEDSSYNTRPATIGPGYQLTRPNPNDVILLTGGGDDFQDKGQKGYSFQDDLTFNSFDWHGGHTVKTGLKYKAITIDAFQQQPYNAQFSYDITQSFTVPFRVRFGEPNIAGDRNVSSHNKQFGVYVQDDWEVNEHLLLNLGVRWDYEQTPAYNDYVTPAGLVAALRGWSNIHAPAVDYDIEDYISTGSNRSAFKGAWQPRLGFSYDINADQRHVVFGGAGRSYDRNLFDYLALERSKSTFPEYIYQFNTPGHPCTVGVGTCLAWNASYLEPATLAALVAGSPKLGAEVDLINNDLKTPYSDQFSIGMRNSFEMAGNDWNSSITYMHVLSHDGIVFTLGNRRPDGTFRPPGTTWGNSPFNSAFEIPGYGRLIKEDNGIETKLDSVLISLEKPYTKDSGWGVTLAYTWSQARENRANAYENDEHFEGDYSTVAQEGFHRTLGLARNRLVVTGIKDGWGGVVFSGKITLASPVPRYAINCHDTTDFDHCFFDPFTLGNAIGFKQVDLAAQKEWRVGDDMAFRLRLDVLNAFNWRNWTDYETWRGGPSPDFNPNFGLRNNIGIVNPTQTFKVSAGFTF